MTASAEGRRSLSFPTFSLPQVAVVGAGDVGCGWAALAASAGWQVRVFDADARLRQIAPERIARRARDLVAVGRAPESVVEGGLRDVHLGRSLLQTVAEADWIIESSETDLSSRQRMVEAIDDVAQRHAVITSAANGEQPSKLGARAERQDRIAFVHSPAAPEMIPLVELIPGPHTSDITLETIRTRLRSLGRIPVTLKREIAGLVTGRITAAVWREAIHLVLEGVIGVDDLDRAVSLGPALLWAAMGPLLSYCVTAESVDVSVALQARLREFEERWKDLATWTKLEPEQQRRLLTAVDQAYRGKIPQLREARDRRLAAILKALEDSRG